MSEIVEITGLGAEGDGVATNAAGAPIFIPQALPGERWQVEEGYAPEPVELRPDRRRPPDPDDEPCGGCVARHMPLAMYQEWKREFLVRALRQQNISADIQPLITVSEHTRRRATFNARRIRGAMRIGYHGRRSHDLVAAEDCPVLDKRIVELLPALAQLASVVAGQEEETRVAITLTDTGADVDLEGNERALSAAARAKIGEITGAARMARVSVGGVPVIERQAPVLQFAGKAVTPPPGAFLQAVPEAEQAMIDLVTAALGKAKQVGDLFCGLGTLTLPIAQKARVTAFDADRNAIAALNEAQRKNQGLKPFTAKPRDLFRDALSPMEMKDLDAVVLDPPRAGAKAQCERLAQSKVKRVVMVSCNPATLARDLRILIDGGYRLDAITPIDQFLYSPHLEAVAALTR
ncbi:methyltransferase [Hyphomicrobium sp. CS1BSMeth3]|uniref:class I SAM-dependent RNA methyltransferase n=1 Tax=Hyphomicrobium sp. CS1BSMeth3 TaxID=1892844 RepID=UPI00093064A2|nr:methyltransferase [Hyphomicrobium sp. CS1BSMeth3]